MPRIPLDAFRKLYTVGPAIAFIIGPLIGGQIAAMTSQRAVFVGCAIIFTGAFLLATRLSEPPMHNHGNRRGGYIDIIRHRPIRMVVIYGFVMVFVLGFGTTFLPNLVTDKYGFDDQQRGLAFSFGAVGTLILSIAMSKTKRITHIRGVALGVLSVSGICVAALVISNPYLLIPAFMMRGGFMMAWSLLTPLASDITPKHLQERTFAGIEFSTGVGNTLRADRRRRRLRIQPIGAISDWRDRHADPGGGCDLVGTAGHPARSRSAQSGRSAQRAA